jgi:hypothetical protein
MEFLVDNWQAILFAVLVAARSIVSLLPTDSEAIPVFGWLDRIITALVGGDKRNNK